MRAGFFLAFALLLAPAAVHAAEDKAVEVISGRSVTFTSPISIGDTANSNPEVFEVILDRDTRQVTVVGGRRAGSGTYIIWSPNRKRRYEVLVKVRAQNYEATAQALRDAFIDIDGVTVRIVADQVLVEGTVVLPEELIVIDRVLSKYPEAVNLVGLDQSVLNTLAKAIEQEIGRDTVHTKVVGDTILLEGYVYSEAEKKRAQDIADALLPRTNNKIQIK